MTKGECKHRHFQFSATSLSIIPAGFCLTFGYTGKWQFPSYQKLRKEFQIESYQKKSSSKLGVI